MDIQKSLVPVGSKILTVDTIIYEGSKWLVPYWLEKPAEGCTMPLRIICMDLIHHQESPDHETVDYVVNDPVPQSVFDGETDTVEGRKFRVVERPNIRISVGRA